VEFSKDLERHDANLRERTTRRAAKRGAVEPFVDEGLVPKSEPVEEGVIGPPEYVYSIPDASPEGIVIVKTEQL
jgi:hypothetical protein